MSDRQDVAQTCSLLYRGFAIRRRGEFRTACRLQVGDSAECNSARRLAGLVRAGSIPVSVMI